MISASPHWFHKWFFGLYFRHIFSSDFKAVHFPVELPTFPKKPIVLLANHFSWWDGFFYFELNNRLFHKQFHVMMLEEQLAKRSFLRRLGAFGIRKNSRDIITGLQYTVQLLQNPSHMVLLFPQGHIESSYVPDIRVEKGVEHIIRQSPQAQIVFAATLVDYFSHRKPTATVYVETCPQPPEGPIASSYQQFYKRCVEKQMLQHVV